MESVSPELRRSTAIRVGIAVLVSAAITALAIVAIWGPLDVKTDVVGFPVFTDFNVLNYYRAYYLAIGFFPIAALGLFLLLTRFAPRLGLAAPPSRGGLRTLLRAPGEEPVLAAEQPLGEAPESKRRAVGAARIAFVGLVVAFEVGVAADSWALGVPLGLGGYLIAVAAGAWALGRARSGWPLESRVAAANAFGTLLTVAGLLAVSLSTELTVASTGEVRHFDWFPVWLALPLLAVLAWVVTAALGRAGSAARAFDIERHALVLVAVPAGLFLLLQVMTGDLGELDMFHVGEQLVGNRLVEEGWLPWRDVVLTHGIFQDVVYSFGRWAFDDSAWGYTAGAGMIMAPLFFLSLYYLFAYLLGRNWLLLTFAVLLTAGTIFVPNEFRLILMPPAFLLLAMLLRRPTLTVAIGLAFLIVVQVILTPEAVPLIPGVALVLLAYEAFWRRPGATLWANFRRTLWVGAAGVAFAVVFFAYLGARGGLDDYWYVSLNLVHGHALSGGVPPGPNPGTLSEVEFHVLALAPPIALLISFAYAIARLRTRRGFYVEDWVMAVNVIFLILYYPKFLARMDTGHVYQPFVAALPLMLYIVLRAVTAVEDWIRERGPKAVLRLTVYPLSLAIAAVTAVLAWGSLNDRVENARVFHHVTVTEEPEIERVGYTQAFDTEAYRDLEKVVDAYLEPGERFFDFSNTPAIFFYFMDRDASTRYFHVAITYPAELQRDLIRRLRQDPPKLIAFDNDSHPFIGLSNFDGMATSVHLYDTSQWILDNYKPVLWTNGVTFYARRDQPPVPPAELDLSRKPATRNVAFSVQPCHWGTSPTFFNEDVLPPPDARTTDARLRSAPNQITVVGWAGDPRAKQPASEVIATVDGRIVARDRPSLNRPDLVAFGLPEGFRRAGFQMQVPVTEGGTLRLFAVSEDGELSQIVRQGKHPGKGTARVGDREIELTPNAVWGQINSKTRAEAVQFSLPGGESDWSDYRWLEVDAGSDGFEQGLLTVYDSQSRSAPDRDIIFETLDRSPDRYVVPVGACAQWHGYRGDRLFINLQPRQEISAVRLIR
jgi:hypothetical protein